MKAKILINDTAGRFKAGEIGDILQNDFPEKYNYLIRLPGIVHVDNFLGRGSIDIIRLFTSTLTRSNYYRYGYEWFNPNSIRVKVRLCLVIYCTAKCCGVL